MVTWFQAAPCSQSTELPARQSSRHIRRSAKRKKRSTHHKKHPAFWCKTNSNGKSITSEVGCLFCTEIFPGDDGLLDHLIQHHEDQCTCGNVRAIEEEAGRATRVSTGKCSDGATPASGLPGGSSDEPAASSRRKGVTRFMFNKFSHRKEAGLEKVDCCHSKQMVGGKIEMQNKTLKHFSIHIIYSFNHI